MLEALTHTITSLVTHSGYIAVFLLMTLESAFIPIPSEVTMPFAGFLSQSGQLSLPVVIILGAVGNLVGSLIIYALGFYLEENLILKLIDKYGKFMLLRRQEYEKALGWFKKYGSSVTFSSRLLPGIRSFISLPAGLAEMNIFKFSLYTFVGSLIWSGFLAYVGFFLGKNWSSIHKIFQKLEIVIILLIVAAVLYFINRRLKIIKFKKHKQ